MGNKKDRTGECGITNEGERVEIIKYNSSSDSEVKIISSGEIIKIFYYNVVYITFAQKCSIASWRRI